MSGLTDSTLGKDLSVTIRFNKNMIDIIDNLADEYGITRSDIIRMATDNALERFLNHVRYLDQDQAAEIGKNITKLGNTMSESLYNLKRIGCNFDQLLRKINSGQVQNLQDREELISLNKLEELITRMERVAQKVGGDLSVFKN